MPNTGLGTPYIVSTDLVANYPTVSSDLADHIDEVSVNSFATSTARSTAIPSPVEGQVSYLENINIVEAYTGAAWTPISKILQIVRATDSTDRSTTSSTLVDANISVTITPLKSDSVILIIWTAAPIMARTTGNNNRGSIAITDNSNNAISGAQQQELGTLIGDANTTNQQWLGPTTIIAYSTPATTSATTYKGRFGLVDSGSTLTLRNSTRSTGQMYAIEVSA